MTLQFAIFESYGGQLLADFSHRVQGLKCSSGERGWEAASGFVDTSLIDAFRFYTAFATAHVEINVNGIRVWEGRLEDPALDAGDAGGLAFGALGYWRAFTDLLYTALWSTTSVAEWEPIDITDLALRNPKMYALDTNNRLFLGLTKNSTYRDTNDIGSLTIQTPDASSRGFVGFMFTAAIALPNNWKFEVRALDRAFGSAASLFIFTGTGAGLNRAWYLTFSAKARIEVAIYNQTGANATFAGENGTNYVRLTKVRAVSSTANAVSTTLTVARAAGTSVTATVGSTARMYTGMQLVMNSGGNPSEIVTVEGVTNGTQFVATFVGAYAIGNAVQGFVVYADEIAQDLVAATNALNPTQISSSSALVQSPGVDVTDESYEDEYAADILIHLAGLGDDATPPNVWEVGVYENRALYFRPRGDAARTWYVDALDMRIERSANDLENSVYAAYEDANNRTLRTGASTSATSITRYAITRQAKIDAQTTSSFRAQQHADTELQDKQDPTPRARVSFDRIYDASGARWPLYYVRAGDTIAVRNLPGASGSTIDRVRSFRVTHAEYDIDNDDLSTELQSSHVAIETLLVHVAQQATARVTKRFNSVRRPQYRF